MPRAASAASAARKLKLALALAWGVHGTAQRNRGSPGACCGGAGLLHVTCNYYTATPILPSAAPKRGEFQHDWQAGFPLNTAPNDAERSAA